MRDDKVTTPTISTLLLVPAAGDPLGLLHGAVIGPGKPPHPLGACPPYAYFDGMWIMGSGGPLVCNQGFAWDRKALVLAYDGEPVPEGCDRLEWVDYRFSGGHWPPGRRVVDFVRSFLAGERSPENLLPAQARLVRGALLALDPAGRDVTDEVLRG